MRAQRSLILLAGVTVLVEVLQAFGWPPSIVVGGYGLSPSILPAVGLVLVLGRRVAGRAGDAHSEVVFWAATAMALLALTVAFVRIDRASTVLAVLAASFDEEVVYRLAIPLILTLALVGWGVRADWARMAGFVAAGTWFVLLPGHRSQMSTLPDALPFLAFAALAAVIVYRSGSVLAVIAMHATTDLANLLAMGDRLGPNARMTILVALFLLLVMAYGTSTRGRSTVGRGPGRGRQPGLDSDVIDLRDSSRPPSPDPRQAPDHEASGQADDEVPVR